MTKPPVRTTRPKGVLREGRADWYRIHNRAKGDGPTSAEVRIFDEIGGWFGVTAADFARDLDALDVDRIDLLLNTPGGDVFDGIAIFNTLRQHRAEVHVRVDALAASAGSIIAMAGDTIEMARGSMMMIHDGWGLTIGNAADHEQTAALLDKASDNLSGIYAARAGGTAAEWREAMRAETWYSAEEAVQAGLADVAEAPPDGEDGDGGESQEAVAAKAFDLSVFAYAGRGEAPAPTLPAVTGGGMAGEQPDPTEQALRDLLTHELLGGAL